MIILGTPIVIGTAVALESNSGFDGVRSMRLTNTTLDVIVINNSSGVGQSQEYLMPLTQMVYPTVNTASATRLQGLTLPANEIANGLLVEFGTDHDLANDFAGTYPYAMAVA